MKDGKIEQANGVVRDASFICNHLGKSVITEFAMLLQDTANEVKEFKELVSSKIINCPHPNCSFQAFSIHSLNAHVGRKHKK